MNFWLATIATYAVVQNAGCAVAQWWLLRRQKAWPAWVTLLPFAWAVLMVTLFLLEVFEPPAWKPFMRDHLYMPMAIEMVWNVLLLQVLFPVMIFVVLVVRFRDRRQWRAPVAREEGISRRRFLYLVGCGAAPVTAIGMGVHGGLTREELRTSEYRIPLANLPPELEGFTIAHVSDLHSGIFVGPDRLKLISDATNDLKADMIVITGDIINREFDEFSNALVAIKRMEAPHGLYLCEGNHDIIPGIRAIVGACERNGLAMLYNKYVTLPFGQGRLVIGGLSWRKYLVMDTQPTMVRDLFPERQEGDVRLLLAHHPDIFDIAQEADLTLSGHTHGGQIMCGDIGLGRLRFKYWSGLYQHPIGASKMIVSNGCGDWFPCRIGAPAEVARVTLTRG
jgi:predicted MPP superfamily phosphohydrolase